MPTWEGCVVADMCDDDAAVLTSPFFIIYTIATRLKENFGLGFCLLLSHQIIKVNCLCIIWCLKDKVP